MNTNVAELCMRFLKRPSNGNKEKDHKKGDIWCLEVKLITKNEEVLLDNRSDPYEIIFYNACNDPRKKGKGNAQRTNNSMTGMNSTFANNTSNNNGSQFPPNHFTPPPHFELDLYQLFDKLPAETQVVNRIVTPTVLFKEQVIMDHSLVEEEIEKGRVSPTQETEK